MDGFHVFGNVVLLTTPEPRRTGLRPDREPTWDEAARWPAGVSRLPNDAGLIYKVLGMETEPVRAAVRDFCVHAAARRSAGYTPPTFSWR